MDIGTIFSTILFIGPGFFIRVIEDEVYSNGNRFDTNERHITKAFIDSFIILIVNLIIFKKFSQYNFFVFSYFISKFNSIEFFIKYILLTFFTSIIYAVLIKKSIKVAWLVIKNCFNVHKFVDKINRTIDEIYKYFKIDIIETHSPTIWESTFNSNKKNFLGKIIVIEKDGTIVSCGHLGESTSINSDIKEIKLTDTNGIKSYMLEEEFKKNYIDSIEFEYYDFESGTLLKCYKLVEDAFNKYNNRKEDEKLQTNE